MFTPPVDEVNFDTLLLQATCYVPASIAFVIPRHSSGILLNPLRAWYYPSSLPFVPKRRCLLALCIMLVKT